MTWEPRQRPLWLEQLNALGSALGDPNAIVSLEADDLIDAATQLVGRHDFGTDDWRAPFGILLASLNDEAHLHLGGRILARTEIMRALVNRLEIAEAVANDPSIATGQVSAPILVTGTGRSGTSLLLELLASDPRHRAPKTWELLRPCPPPHLESRANVERIAAAHNEVTFWNQITPEYQTMHENGGDLPNECIFMTQPTFVSDHWMGSYPTPSYGKWLARADRSASFAYHRQFLQLLQSQQPTQQWVLKAASHLSQLRAFFSEYPDARVVITHRDPLRVLGSITDLMATLQWQKSNTVPYEQIVHQVTAGTAMIFDLLEQWRNDGTLPSAQIIDVRYCDLVRFPIETMRTTYEALDIDFDATAEAAVRTYLDAHAQHRGGVHEYSFADTGLDFAATRALFQPYMNRFDLPEEVQA